MSGPERSSGGSSYPNMTPPCARVLAKPSSAWTRTVIPPVLAKSCRRHASGIERAGKTKADVVVPVVRLVVVAVGRAEVVWIVVVRRAGSARLRHDEPPRRTRLDRGRSGSGATTWKSPCGARLCEARRRKRYVPPPPKLRRLRPARPAFFQTMHRGKNIGPPPAERLGPHLDRPVYSRGKDVKGKRG